jgi:hypothetical protein
MIARGDGYLAMLEDPTNKEKAKAHMEKGN